MAEKSEKDHTIDPFEAWRNLRDAAMETWSKNWIEAVNTDAYAKATGTMLDTYLAAVQPFRDLIGKTITQTLQSANMPTRSDVIGLAERLTNIEIRLDDLDARLDGFEEGIQALLARPDAAPAEPAAESTAAAAPQREEAPPPAVAPELHKQEAAEDPPEPAVETAVAPPGERPAARRPDRLRRPKAEAR